MKPNNEQISKADTRAVNELKTIHAKYPQMLIHAFRGIEALKMCLNLDEYRALILESTKSRQEFINHAIAKASNNYDIQRILSDSDIFKDFPNEQKKLQTLIDSMIFNESHTLTFKK